MFAKPASLHVRRRSAFGETISSAAGAIDLASVMVGVIVIGVIAGTIAATVFAVIPWSQDAAAKQSLDAVRTAEAVNQAQASKFTDFNGLRTADLIQASTTVNVATDADGSCYVAVSQSASGAVFLSTDVSPNIETVTSTTTTTCLAEAKLATLIESVRVGASGAQGADVDYVGTFAGGDEHTVVMDENGKLWSWGNGIYGQLGNGAFVRNQAQRVAVLSDLTFTQVTASTYHTAAIDSTGHLWTWGVNTYGQLGIQPYLDKSHTPIAVRPDLIFTQVTAGYGHTVALDNTGQLWSWGLDNMGQLGNDLALQTYNVPVKVLEGRKFKQVSTGNNHTVALETTGELWSWGRNTNGQLGLGDRTNRPTPAKVAFAPVIDKVATGDRHTVVLDSTGKLWSWGYDEYGQLGDDATKLDQTIPKAVLSETKFKDVAGGMLHTAAIDTTGKLWSWGWDSNGQLGDGISEPGDKPTPVAVVFEPALPDLVFSHVTAGARHTLAMDNTGQLWSWGLDNTGQLGDDAALVSKSNPVKVTVW